MTDQAYIAGVLNGDGWCTSKTLGLRVADLDFAEAFRDALNRETSAAFKIGKCDRGYWFIRKSNASGRFTGMKTFEPRTDVEKAYWLRGLFDSEGHASVYPMKNRPDQVHRKISFTTTDAETVRRCVSYLADLGLKTRTIYPAPCANRLGTKPVCHIIIARKESMIAFETKVGTNIERKKAALRRIATEFCDDDYARRGQKMGALVRRDKMLSVTLPFAIEQLEALAQNGVKITQRLCLLQIPGYHALLNHFTHREVLAKAAIKIGV